VIVNIWLQNGGLIQQLDQLQDGDKLIPLQQVQQQLQDKLTRQLPQQQLPTYAQKNQFGMKYQINASTAHYQTSL